MLKTVWGSWFEICYIVCLGRSLPCALYMGSCQSYRSMKTEIFVYQWQWSTIPDFFVSQTAQVRFHI